MKELERKLYREGILTIGKNKIFKKQGNKSVRFVVAKYECKDNYSLVDSFGIFKEAYHAAKDPEKYIDRLCRRNKKAF